MMHHILCINCLKNKILPIFFIGLLLLVCACSKKQKQGFSYDLMPVELNGKWGYIDKTGNFLINPQYQMAYLFSDGLALIEDKNGRMGYIDTKGDVVVDPIYFYASNFSEGLAFVTPENHVPTCIDKKGRPLFQLYDADKVYAFSEGLALVQSGENHGFVNTSGKFVIAPQYEKAAGFSEGLAAVGVDAGANIKSIRWGYIDKTGKMIISPQFDAVQDFKENLAFVKDPVQKKWGIIDRKGDYVITPQFDDATFFSEDLAAVKLGDSWGFINPKGRFIINPQFDEVLPFHEKVAAVSTGRNSWKIIDHTGKLLNNRTFKALSRFFDHHAMAVNHDNGIGLVNRYGSFVVQPVFSNAFPYYDPNIGFFNQNLFTYVISDFYNAHLIADIFLKNSDDSTFRMLSDQTTYQYIMESPLYRNLTETSRYGIAGKYPVEIVKDLAFIGAIEFEFQTPIYRIEPKYYYGHKIGEDKIIESDAQLESATFVIYMGFSDVAYGKESMFCEALKNAIYQHYKIVGSEAFFTENKIILTTDRLRFILKCANDNITLTVEFIAPNSIMQEKELLDWPIE